VGDAIQPEECPHPLVIPHHLLKPAHPLILARRYTIGDDVAVKNDKPPSRSSGLPPDGSSEFGLAHDAPRLGNYLVSVRLAVGRVTEVRMAFDVTFDRRVAIKRLLPQFVQDPVCRARFQRGARLQAQIRHAGVPAVHGADLDGEIPYVAMELVEGHTLAEFAQAAGALPPEIVALIGCDVARTLQDIHETGAVHRQLLPEHILIDRHGVGRLVVIGFGQVAVPEPDDQEPLTGPGTLIGYLHHAAPEQLACEPVDERADIYPSASCSTSSARAATSRSQLPP
jgi:serine/threonine protein kinase